MQRCHGDDIVASEKKPHTSNKHVSHKSKPKYFNIAQSCLLYCFNIMHGWKIKIIPSKQQAIGWCQWRVCGGGLASFLQPHRTQVLHTPQRKQASEKTTVRETLFVTSAISFAVYVDVCLGSGVQWRFGRSERGLSNFFQNAWNLRSVGLWQPKWTVVNFGYKDVHIFGDAISGTLLSLVICHVRICFPRKIPKMCCAFKIRPTGCFTKLIKQYFPSFDVCQMKTLFLPSTVWVPMLVEPTPTCKHLTHRHKTHRPHLKITKSFVNI